LPRGGFGGFSPSDTKLQTPKNSRFWKSVSGFKLTIPLDIQPANRIVIISGTNEEKAAVLPTLRFFREFGLVFLWICGFSGRLAVCLFLGLF